MSVRVKSAGPVKCLLEIPKNCSGRLGGASTCLQTKSRRWLRTVIRDLHERELLSYIALFVVTIAFKAIITLAS